ncbi:Gfo/Idh/MocA family protein [Paenibacillus spongiae]|uniref:Gfo/Idh/MocA family oxidoreductase n=1 Tax=Paenibacillus spongiae TaxID=2909671 RepID=A0ABY5SDK3_9BACL|nr:Gfo/Idh/MocA family oxidoreductase [Paenibacillus spongiae]UVI30805.1 Gfo/Idh/MocA family oxidoreductase [Paenibacillus spongiae]
MSRIRIGVIGIGDIAQKAYLPLLAVHRDIHIAGLMSRNPDKVSQVAEQYRIDGRFTRMEELLEQDIQAVFVHSATEAHYDIVMRCLARGLHVYVDKPLSYDIVQSEEMAAEAARQGKLLAVGFNRRFAPMVLRAKEWITEAGGGGTILVQKNRIKLQGHSAKESLYDDAIHAIDLAGWLACGADDQLELSAGAVRSNEKGQLLSVFGMLRGERAVSAFSMERRSGADVERLEWHGSGRTAIVHNLEQAVLSEPGSGGHTLAFGGWDSHLQRRGFAGIVDHVLASLNDPQQCTVRADQVLRSHRLVEELLTEQG